VRRNPLGGSTLHDLAEIHHRNLVGYRCDEAQAVADQKHGEVELLGQVGEQVYRRGRRRRVEARGRLVGDDQLS